MIEGHRRNDPSGGTMNQRYDVEVELEAYAARSSEATAKAAQAFARLLTLAEQHSSGQTRCIACFIAATYNGYAFPFDLFELRAVDIAISDDMLICLDALRWASADLYKLVPDGQCRVKAILERWNLKWTG